MENKERETLAKLNMLLKTPEDNVEEILKILPDDYYYWSILKKRLLNENFIKDRFIEICKNQYELNNACIEENPKSYQTWYHREFIMKKLDAANLLDDSIRRDEEMIMMSILNYDDRNFHAYGYMRFLGIGRNLFFFLFKENVHNYSALHELMQIYEKDLTSSKQLSKTYANNKTCMNIDIESLILQYPENEALWHAYATKKEIDRRTHIKAFKDHFLIIFAESYAGEITINISQECNKIKILTNVEYKLPFIKIWCKLASTDKIEISLDNASKKFKFAEKQDLFAEKVLEIDNYNRFALMEKLEETRGNKRDFIIEKLIEVDPIRKGYYKMIRNDESHVLYEIR